MIEDGWVPEIQAIGIEDYRSFTSLEVLPFTSRALLIAGPNNVGKSNILRFLTEYVGTKPTPSSLDMDRPLGIGPGAWSPALMLAISREDVEERAGSLVGRGPWDYFSAKLSLGESDHFWLRYEMTPATERKSAGWAPVHGITNEASELGISPSTTRDFYNRMLGINVMFGHEDVATFLANLYLHLADSVLHALPKVRSVDAFRQVRPGREASDARITFDGSGLVDRLAELQNPGMGGKDKRQQFEAINAFVRQVLDDESATLSIPHDKTQILVDSDDGLLPLASLGTGVHQTVILGAAATMAEGKLLCIEEPEVHLHPILQRRLLSHLVKSTSNRYVIATHSAHLLDSERATIVRVAREAGGATRIEPAVGPKQLSALCQDLGYRASDILQTNAMLWVEGPSDRTYLKHWINSISPVSLVEGVHYSVMFYGGALLSHLETNDSDVSAAAVDEHVREVDDFIQLRRINRNLMVLIDSDKNSAQARINATKRRVRDALDSYGGGGFAWITGGYTIENYVPRDLLARAFAEVHPSAELTWDGGKWANPFANRKRGSRARGGVSPRKTLIARRVVQDWSPDGFSKPLVSQVRRVVDLILEANGREPANWRVRHDATL